ncbi:MAG: response regulator transcription factor [Chloroflexota bacterium]
MTTILLIDDDPLITEPLARSLRQNNYTVEIAANGRSGLDKALTLEPDIVVLDIMMPEMDGWEVCRQLRNHSAVPILMLTALGDEVDRILGLEMGADDYLTKPFSSRELVARIRAMLRRVKLDQAVPTDDKVVVAGIVLDLNRRQVKRNGRLLQLRFKEFELLSLLMSRAGDVVSRAEIFDDVWGTDWLGDTRTLDVHIRWLREKLEDDASKPYFIQTVRGVGYRFISD